MLMEQGEQHSLSDACNHAQSSRRVFVKLETG